MVKQLKLDGFRTSFPLDTPLIKNGAFLKWKEKADERRLLKLLSTSLHDTKVMYCVKVNKPVNLSPVVRENLEYLCSLCGFNEDLQVVALKLSENELNYAAYISEPQEAKERPIHRREARNHFSKYDG